MKKKIAIGVLVFLFALLGVGIFIGPPKVPKEAIATRVTHDAALLEAAWQTPVAASFGRDLHWQTNGSYCGPASLVNVFHSLGLPSSDEGAMVDGSGYCRLGFCFLGLTLDQLAEVASLKTTKKVSVLRDLTPETFLENLKHVGDPGRRYIVNFNRKPIFGAGGGHHSPIGAYLADKDLVLVLDVNNDFKPWLIERERLFAAIDTVDSASGKKRGLLLIE